MMDEPARPGDQLGPVIMRALRRLDISNARFSVYDPDYIGTGYAEIDENHSEPLITTIHMRSDPPAPNARHGYPFSPLTTPPD